MLFDVSVHIFFSLSFLSWVYPILCLYVLSSLSSHTNARNVVVDDDDDDDDGVNDDDDDDAVVVAAAVASCFKP